MTDKGFVEFGDLPKAGHAAHPPCSTDIERFRSPSRDLTILRPMVYRISIDFEAGTMHTRLQEDDHRRVAGALETVHAWEECGAQVVPEK